MKYPDWLKNGGFPIGSLADFRRGTIERAKIITIALLSAWDLATTTGEKWEMEIRRAKKENAHRLLGFERFDDYLHAAIGSNEGDAKKRFETNAETKRGRDRRSNDAMSMDRQDEPRFPLFEHWYARFKEAGHPGADWWSVDEDKGFAETMRSSGFLAWCEARMDRDALQALVLEAQEVWLLFQFQGWFHKQKRTLHLKK
jgi:hypothetical protein